jgi:hypothetical protein
MAEEDAKPRSVAVLNRGDTSLVLGIESSEAFRDDDEALEAFVWLEGLKKQFSQAKAEVEQLIILHIQATGRPLILGGQAIKVGTSSTEPCVDVSKAVDEALGLLGGDIDTFVELLARNALKPGACGTILGKEFREKHFRKKWKDALSATGARKEAHKYLQRMPAAMLPKKKEEDDDETPPEPPGYGNPDNIDIEKERLKHADKEEDRDIDY